MSYPISTCNHVSYHGNSVQGYRSLPRNLKGGRLSLLPGSTDNKAYSMTCQRRSHHHGNHQRRARTPSSAIFNRLSLAPCANDDFLAANSNDKRDRTIHK